jgi:hypothetical protein
VPDGAVALAVGQQTRFSPPHALTSVPALPAAAVSGEVRCPSRADSAALSSPVAPPLQATPKASPTPLAVPLVSGSVIHQRPSSPMSSRTHADRLVHATLTAEQRKRRRHRANCHCSTDERFRCPRHHHHLRHLCASHDVEEGDLNGECYPTDDERAIQRSRTSDEHSSSNGSSSSNATALDTYDMLQRQRRHAEMRERQVCSAYAESSMRESCSKGMAPKSSAKDDGRRLPLAQYRDTIRGSAHTTPPGAVSVDCVSVQLPLRGRANGDPRTGALSAAPSTTTATRSTSRSLQRWPMQHRCDGDPSVRGVVQQAGGEGRGNGAAFAASWHSSDSAGAPSTMTTTQGTTLIEVAVDTRAHRDANQDHGTNGSGVCEERCPTVDASLFQDALALPPAFSLPLSPSRTNPFVSPPSDSDENINYGGVQTPFPWRAGLLCRARDLQPIASQADFDDHPFGWTPPSQQAPRSPSPSYLTKQRGRDTDAWTMMMMQPHGEEKRAHVASPSPRWQGGNWPLSLPGADTDPPNILAYDAEPREGGGADGFNPFEHQHPASDQPSHNPWWAPPGASWQREHENDGEMRFAASSFYPLPFTYGHTAGGSETAVVPLSNSSAPPARQQLPPLPPPQHNRDRQLGQLWHPQQQPNDPQQQQGGVFSSFPPYPPQRSSSGVVDSDGNAGRTGQRGAGGSRRRHATPRTLNGTTERCRRFWERCRCPPAPQQPQFSRSFTYF